MTDTIAGPARALWVQNFNYPPHVIGGAERSARELALGLSERGHAVRIIVSDSSQPYPERVDGLPVTALEGLPIGRSPLHADRTFPDRILWNLRSEIDPVLTGRIRRALRQDRPDLIVMNNPSGHGSAMLAAARAEAVPVIPVIRDYAWFCGFGVMQRGSTPCASQCKVCQVYALRRRALLQQAPAVIAISEYVAERTRQLMGGGAVRRIYNSLPDAFIDAPASSPRALGPRPLRFGYLGRLHPSKGVDALIKAWREAGVQGDGHTLHLAGPLQGVDLPAQADEIGLVYEGSQPALEFLDRVDVLFVPSIWGEAFGRTVIEGVARRCYVVGAPSGAIPELIRPGLGELLPDVSAASIAAVIGRLASDPQAVFRSFDADRSQALAPFRRARMLDAYEQAIQEALAP